MKKRRARRRLELEEQVHRFPGSDGFGYQVPPTFDSVFIYFNQKGYSRIDVLSFGFIVPLSLWPSVEEQNMGKKAYSKFLIFLLKRSTVIYNPSAEV